MKQNFTNEQLIYTLRQAKGETSVAEICRWDRHHRANIRSLEEGVRRMGVAEHPLTER